MATNTKGKLSKKLILSTVSSEELQVRRSRRVLSLLDLHNSLDDTQPHSIFVSVNPLLSSPPPSQISPLFGQRKLIPPLSVKPHPLPSRYYFSIKTNR